MKRRLLALGLFTFLTVGTFPTLIITSSAGSETGATLTPTASVEWVQPSEFTWGPPNTMTVAGYAQGGYGNVQMFWRDLTDGNGWNEVAWQAIPDPTTHTWSNTLDSPNRCHDYAVYVNYSGIQSATFYYRGLTSGYCNEQVSLTWIQPSSSAGIGFGSPGSLIVAGSATGAPPGNPIWVMYRNATAGTGWVILNDNETFPNSNGTWLKEIPNANPNHVYEVKALYDVVTSAVCSYAGNNSITWCQ